MSSNLLTVAAPSMEDNESVEEEEEEMDEMDVVMVAPGTPGTPTTPQKHSSSSSSINNTPQQRRASGLAVVGRLLIVEEEDQDEEGQPLDSWRSQHGLESSGSSSREDEEGAQGAESNHSGGTTPAVTGYSGHSMEDGVYEEGEEDEEDEEDEEPDEIVIDAEAEEEEKQAQLEAMTDSEREAYTMEEYKRNRTKNANTYDEYGFEITDGSEPKIPTLEEQEVILRRTSKWEDMIANWGTYTSKKKKKLRERIRKGIPNGVRSRVWPILSGSKFLMQQYPHTYKIVLGEETHLKWLDTLDKDLDRTYPEHYEFADADGRGQQKLWRTLKAFMHHRQNLGYVQGMAMVAGLMLMYMGEEEAFWMMVAVNDNYMPGVFDQDLSQFHIDVMIYDDLLEQRLPTLAKHLKANMVHSTFYVTKWLLCMYTISLPWETVLAYWDMFLFEGMRWFFTVALAIMTVMHDDLLKLNIEGLMETLQHGTYHLTVDVLFPVADKINLSKKELNAAHGRAKARFDNGEFM